MSILLPPRIHSISHFTISILMLNSQIRVNKHYYQYNTRFGTLKSVHCPLCIWEEICVWFEIIGSKFHQHQVILAMFQNYGKLNVYGVAALDNLECSNTYLTIDPYWLANRRLLVLDESTGVFIKLSDTAVHSMSLDGDITSLLSICPLPLIIIPTLRYVLSLPTQQQNPSMFSKESKNHTLDLLTLDIWSADIRSLIWLSEARKWKH